jgi:hypothetical protein
MKLQEAPVNETWYSDLVDLSEDGEIPEEILEFVYLELDFHVARKGSQVYLEKVLDIIEDLPRKIQSNIEDSIYAIQDGSFKREYKKQYGEYSASAEFLKSFRQAVTYFEDDWDWKELYGI